LLYGVVRDWKFCRLYERRVKGKLEALW